MRKIMHNILFENAGIISGIIAIYLLLGVFMPVMELIITDRTPISFVLMIGVTAFIITIAMWFLISFVFEEYCYDQKTSNENWERNKYKS